MATVGAGEPSGQMIKGRVTQHREEVHFRMLRLIAQRPEASQREISCALDMSLGAVNYCMRALLDKGHVKIANFRASRNKLGYVYVLTPEGIAHRASLAARFIERKMAEYEAIKTEIDELRDELAGTVSKEN
jgi:EPS-associated MarR family transcriptional regulator